MLNTPMATKGMVVAPHHSAAQTGLSILREGGTAIDAMIAAAATIAAVYPHMNALGGDGFWLISLPGQSPIAIDACGAAAVDPAFYRDQGISTIPSRGPLAANTVAGTLSGWDAARRINDAWRGAMPLGRLLEDAIAYAENGIRVTQSQHLNTAAKLSEVGAQPGFADVYLQNGAPPLPGALLKQPAMANTLQAIADHGPDSFYRGDLAKQVAADLARAGSPVTETDLAAHTANKVTPLTARVADAQLFNMTPPTQGLASLMILAIFEQLSCADADGFEFIHQLVEATKQAFLIRDSKITDPAYSETDFQALLENDYLKSLAAKVDTSRALPWPQQPQSGDTVWLGAVDQYGCAVSFIQSIYWEFGSGIVLRDSGLLWQNRGASFSLDPAALNPIARGRKPFHTLNPAMAHFNDGRIMPYGTMGGEGQPQTQAALFARYAMFNQSLQEAISGPRWLLGRTWGAESTTLKIEDRFDPAVLQSLINAGHDVERLGPFEEVMGHAGAVVRHADGLVEGAADPRSDGAAAGY